MLALILMSLLQAMTEGRRREHQVLVFDSAKGMTFRSERREGRADPEGEDKETGKKSTKTTPPRPESSGRSTRPGGSTTSKHLGGKPKGSKRGRVREVVGEAEEGDAGPGPLPGWTSPRRGTEVHGGAVELLGGCAGRKGRAGSRAPGPVAPAAELGLRVETVSETLRDQLSLKENEGVLVAEVKPARRREVGVEGLTSSSDRGKAITDRFQFRTGAGRDGKAGVRGRDPRAGSGKRSRSRPEPGDE